MFSRILLSVTLSIVVMLIFVNTELVFSSDGSEKTVLKFVRFEHRSFNGGGPIVFEGKLTSESGKPIKDAEILIKNDGPCPDDRVIASGMTDTHGRFWILTIAKIWDESDNLTWVHAEFSGTEKFSPSISDAQIIVVYPSHGEKCVN